MKQNQTAFLKLCLADSLIKLMADKPFEDISINAICQTAGVGRTTFYRHLDHKTCKEDLLLFKIEYEWTRYADEHDSGNEEKGGLILRFIYANKKLFLLLCDHGLLVLFLRIIEELITGGESYSKELSYIMSYFIHGYFGIIYQWSKYRFDEPPEQVERHITDAISAAIEKNKLSGQPDTPADSHT